MIRHLINYSQLTNKHVLRYYSTYRIVAPDFNMDQKNQAIMRLPMANPNGFGRTYKGIAPFIGNSNQIAILGPHGRLDIDAALQSTACKEIHLIDINTRQQQALLPATVGYVRNQKIACTGYLLEKKNHGFHSLASIPGLSQIPLIATNVIHLLDDKARFDVFDHPGGFHATTTGINAFFGTTLCQAFDKIALALSENINEPYARDWLLDVNESLEHPTSAYRQAIPTAISIHKISSDIEKTNDNSNIWFDTFIFKREDQQAFFLAYKSIFYRLFNPIAFEESDFNYGEDIQYLKNLIDAAIIQSIKKLDEPKMTITKIEHKPV